ncbi:MAG: diacylglycerol/lipid kinase family protein [Mycobacteriales bacterium]
MRALVVVNPTATTTSPRVREVLTCALGSEFKVEAVHTGHRGHARELAVDAATEGLDVVVVLGGDGTINEVINGLLNDGIRGGRPALAVVPGGCANVFARSLGLPADPVEATGALLDALRAGTRRSIGLGRAGERYFAFCAGLGMDAATVRRVQEKREAGRSPTTARYVRAAVAEFITGTERRRPELHLSVPADGTEEDVHLALVCNTEPWTYLGGRPVHACPQASFETGLDVFALRRMRVLPTLRHLRQLLAASGRGPHGRAILAVHDVAGLTITAREPVAFQLDGEYLGEATSATFTSVPNALEVVV